MSLNIPTFIPYFNAANLSLSGAWILGAGFTIAALFQSILLPLALASLGISLLRWWVSPLVRLPKWLGHAEFTLNSVRYVRRIFLGTINWISASYIIYNYSGSRPPLSQVESILWWIGAILNFPFAVVSAIRRAINNTLFFIVNNKLKVASVLSMGAAAGALYVWRQCKKEAERGVVEKQQLEAKRNGLVLESGRLQANQFAVIDLLQRLVLAGCAWVSILGVVRGVCDNSIIREVVILFTTILRMLSREDPTHACTASSPCCEFRNNGNKLVKTLWSCTCMCHRHRVRDDGTFVDESFATVLSRQEREAAKRVETVLKETSLDEEEDIQIEQEEMIDTMDALGVPIPEEVKEISSWYVRIKSLCFRVLIAVWGRMKSVEMVLVAAFILGFIVGGAVYFYLPTLQRWSRRMKHRGIELDVSIKEVERAEGTPILVVNPEPVEKSTREVAREVGVAWIHPVAVPESRVNKNKKKRARVAQGNYKQADLEEMRLDRADQLAEEWKQRQEEDYNFRMQNWEDANLEEEERKREERAFEDQYGDEYAYTNVNKKGHRKESMKNRVLIESDDDEEDIIPAEPVVKPSLYSAPDSLLPITGTNGADVRSPWYEFTGESKGGNVRLFTYDCPVCGNGTKHRISSCPKNARRNWMFISKRAGYVPKIALGQDLFETEFGYIFNKDKVVVNAAAGTLVGVGHQSKIEGVPIVDVEGIHNYVVPCYDIKKEFQHCLIPSGNYLIGPFHGDQDTGLWVQGPKEEKNAPEGWYKLEKAEFAPNEPAYWVGDDIVFYVKPQFIKSQQIGKIDPDVPANVMLIGYHNGRLAMSGPRKLLEIKIKEGLSDLSTIPVLAHDCSSDLGFSGGAIVDVATGRVVAMHLGTQQTGKRNYAVHLDDEKISAFLKKPFLKKKKGPVAPPASSNLN